MFEKHCSIVPIVSSTGQPSRVFQTTLNFGKFITDDVIKQMDLGFNSIRDLATFMYKQALSLGDNPGLSAYDNTGEVRLENVLASLLNNTIKYNEYAVGVFRHMLDQLNTQLRTIYDPTIKYDSNFRPSDIAYSNRVLSQAYLQVQDQIANSGLRNGVSLKVAVLNQLNKNMSKYNKVRDQFRDAYVQDYLLNVMKQDSMIWKSFLAYINTTYGVNYRNIRHDLTLEDQQGTFQTTEDIQEVWDAVRQDKIDRKNTISSIIKSKLAKILNDANVEGSESNRLYIPDPMDINTIWNQLINLHINDLTIEDIETSIANAALQIPSFAAIQEEFNKAKQGDSEAENFRNAYISGVRLAIVPSNILAIDGDFVANVFTNNKQAFSRNAYIDRFISVIDSNIRFGLYSKTALKSLKAESHAYVNNKRIFDVDYAIDSLMKVYNTLGLAVTRRALEAYANTISDVEVQFTRLATQANYITSEIQAILNGKVTIDEYTVTNNDNKGNLYRLAEVASYDFNSLTNLSYLDVKGELNYSPQYDSLLTKLFRGLSLNGQVRETYLLDLFSDYLNDPTLQTDNFLVYDAKTGLGMFEKVGDDWKVSDKFVSQVEKAKRYSVSQFDGMKLRETGYKYRDLQSTLYKYTEVVANLLENYIFLTSDSPRSYMMSIQHIDTSNLFNSDGTINKDSQMFVALNKIAMNDVNIFNRFGARIFGIDTTQADWNETAQLYHAVKYWNGKTILDNNGIPTGKAFQFKTLTYTEDSKPKTIIDFIAETEEVSVQDVYADIISSTINSTVGQFDVQAYVPQFVARYIQYAQESAVNDFGDIAKFIMNTQAKQGEQTLQLLGQEVLNEIDTVYNDMLKNFVENSKNEKIKSVDDIWQSTKEQMYNNAKDMVLENTDIANSQSFKNGMLKLILNHTVYSNSFNNIVNGKLSEYKNTTDYNKRIAQVIKNGLNAVPTNKPRRVMVMADMDFKNNIAGKLFREVKGVNQVGRVNDTIADLHGGFTTINDSMSIITDSTLEDILRTTGRWEEYASIINDLRDSRKPFNPIAYRKLVEQLKLFGTARRRRGDFFRADTAIRDEQGNIVNDDFANEVDSVQIKDSTIVLFETTTRGTAMGDLYDWMVANQIDQISPISAVKVSGITPVKIHNENAQLVLPETADDKHVLYMESSDFVIQQDVKADILDELTILGNQLLKQLTQGLNMTEAIYNLDGKKVTGQEIFNELQTVVADNIQEDAMTLLNDLGGIDQNGQINLDQNGNIVLSTPKLVKLLQEIVEDDDSSSNIRQALEMDNQGLTTMPLSYPVTYKKFEKLFASRFSKRVINQYLPGLHAPLRADIFNAPNALLDKTNTIIEGDEAYSERLHKLNEEGSISYSQEFIDRCIAEKRSLELRASHEYVDGQLVYRSEVILNPWMKEFFNTIPTIKYVTLPDGSSKQVLAVDIDQIPQEAREMLAIRIPTEGKQSMVLFEVVGFLNTGSTQAIFPQSLVTQTGWDFDIDTIYAYYKHINFDGNVYTIPKFDGSRRAENRQQQLNFFAKQSANQEAYKNHIIQPTVNTSLNSKAFAFVCKAYNKKYGNTQTTTDGIQTLKDSIDNLIDILNSQLANPKLKDANTIVDLRTDIRQLRMLKSNLNAGLQSLINETISNINELLSISQYNTSSARAAQAILQRDLTPEELNKLTKDLNDNYSSSDNTHLYNVLTTINKNIKTTQKVLTKLETMLNKVSVVSEDSKWGLPASTAANTKTLLKSFTEGNVEVPIGGKLQPFNIFGSLTALNSKIADSLKIDSAEVEALGEQVNYARQARDNRILDIATAILGNEYHINETNKPNAMDNIQRVSNRDNALWDRSLDSLNPNNLADKIFLNIVSMGSTILKGHSVNFDNTAAILSTIHASFKQGVTRLINVEDLPQAKDKNGKPIKVLTSTGNLTADYRQYLTDVYGEKNFKFIKNRNALEINDKYINNNATGNNLDLAGDPVSFQLSEVTAAILDILKAGLMFNLNIDTLSIFRMLSAGATTELYYDPRNTSGNRTPNRFSFASAFIQQPAVVDIVETINREKIEDDYFDYKKALNNVHDKYGRLLIDFYMNNRNSDSAIHDDLVRLQSAKGLIKLTKSQIGNILESLTTKPDFYFSVEETNNYTTRELVGFIQDRNSGSAEFLASQLAVLRLFETYNTKAENLTQLSFVLKTEGRVEGFYKADSKELKLADYYMSKSDYKTLLKNTVDKSFDKLQQVAAKYLTDNNKYAEILADFNHMPTDIFLNKYKDDLSIPRRNFITKSDYYQAKSSFDDLITVNDRRNQINYLQLDYEPSASFEVQGKDLIDLIFSGNQNGYVDVQNNTMIDNTIDSAYPIIQARYQFGHWLFANSFDKVFAQRASSIRAAVSKFLLINNQQYNEKARAYVESKLIEYYTQVNTQEQLPLFKNATTQQLQNILGVLPVEQQDEIKAEHKQIATELFGSISDSVTNDKFEKWTKLTLAEQIKLIQTEPTLKAYINRPDFKNSNIFNYITNVRNSRRNNGFDVLQIIKDDNNVISNDDMANSIRFMWYSDVPYIAHTIRSLITYTYYTNGFQYGYNLSKYIPMDLLNDLSPNPSYDTRIIQIGYGDPTVGLSDYAHNLRLAENSMIQGETFGIEKALGYISRQNSALNAYFPNFRTQRLNDQTNVNVASLGYVEDGGNNVGLINVEDSTGETRQLIFETRERVNNSRWANSEYLTKKVGFQKLIYKRSEAFTHNSSNTDVEVYVYYPIGKLLKNEFTDESLVTGYNISQELMLEDGQTMDIIDYAKQSVELSTFLQVIQQRKAQAQANSEINTVDPSDNSSVDVEEQYDDNNYEDFETINPTDAPLYSRVITIPNSIDTTANTQGVMQATEDAINNSNSVIYITTETSTELTKKQHVNSNKSIIVDYTKSPVEEAIRIAKQMEAGKLFLAGDANLIGNYESNYAMRWTTLFMTKLNELTGQIHEIETILNTGFGTAIANTYMDVKRTNIEVSSYDNLKSKFIKIAKPIDNTVENRTLTNAAIALDAFKTIRRVVNAANRQIIPNSDTIKNAYQSLGSEDFAGGIQRALEDSNFEATEAVFNKMTSIQIAILNGIKVLLAETNSVNLNTVSGDYYKFQEYKQKLSLLTQLISTFEKYKGIQKIQIEDTLYDSTKPEDVENYEREFGQLNESIGLLQDLYKQSLPLRNRISEVIQELQIQQVAADSRNPNIPNAFRAVLKAAQKPDFDPNTFDFEKLQLSEAERRQIVSMVFTFKNMDINTFQRWMDSAFVTGVPLIDITGKQYIKAIEASRRKAERINDRLEEALELVNPNYVTNANARAEYFKRFVTDYGDLIDTYDTTTVREELSTLNDLLNDIISKEWFNAGFYISDTHARTILAQMDKAIDDFNSKSHAVVYRLNDADQNTLLATLEDMTERERNAYLKLNNYVELKYIPTIGENPTRTIFKLEYKESAKNPAYAALNDTDQAFIQTVKSLIQETIHEYNPTYIPYSTDLANVLPYLPQAKLSDTLTGFFHMPRIREDQSYEAIDGTKKYYLSAHTLETPPVNAVFNIRQKYLGESWSDYETSVVDAFNRWKQGGRKKVDVSYDITSIKDIRQYNKDTNVANKRAKTQTMSYDIKDIMKSFTGELFNIKAVNDFQTDYDLTLYTLRENDGELHLRNAMAQYDNIQKRVYNTSKIHGALDVASSALLRYSSINYMYLNYTAGIKNVLKGVSDMLIEISGNGFVDAASVRQGMGQIIKTIPAWIQGLRTEKTDNLQVAIVKNFEGIYQDSRDIYSSMTGTDFLTKALSTVDTIGYSPNTMGEFIMQFGMLLAATKSHRVIGGKVYSFGDFYEQEKDTILASILTTDQKRDYYAFKEAKNKEIERYEKKKGKKFYWQGDYAGEFMRLYANKLTKEQRKRYNNDIKENREYYMEQFKKFPTFESQLTVEDGRLSYLPESGLSLDELTHFRERVKGINQALHGVYNRVDRMALQDSASGELFAQFRKWMRPNYVRYFGRRFNEAFFNETLGSWEVPIYKPFFDWTKYGFKQWKQDHPSYTTTDVFKGALKIAAYQLKSIKQLGYYYNTLTPGEQAAAQKWAQHVATVTTVMIASLMLGRLKDDDPELKDSTAYVLLNYELSALFKEVVEPVPLYGWWSTTSTFKESAFVGETVLWNTLKLCRYALLDVIGDENKLYYDRGVYKGQRKSEVALKKALPIIRQIEKQVNLKAHSNIYDYYNPFAN